EKSVSVADRGEMARLFGTYDRNLKEVKRITGVMVVVRNGEIRVKGGREAVERACRAFEKIREIPNPVPGDVAALLDGEKAAARTTAVPGEIFRRGVTVDPKSAGQKRYLQDIDANGIVFSIGPAGTGKTFLAVAKAVETFRAGRVRRIVLVRPAVEAGEKLGFLPGDIQAKVNPYLRPIYDSLNTFLEFGQLQRLIGVDVVEICPLAYMRGRTLNQAFIILDEAQNTTSEQMKMFLTRMGNASRIVVTGDITQVDLPSGKTSGLIEIQGLLKHIQGLEFVYLTRHDIVRHPLVQEIVDAYDEQGKQGKRRH
ncbi:MAG: PhoH family protein, partial [candidate division NC10 bacterium]